VVQPVALTVNLRRVAGDEARKKSARQVQRKILRRHGATLTLYDPYAHSVAAAAAQAAGESLPRMPRNRA
jgi:hypothetical protein